MRVGDALLRCIIFSRRLSELGHALPCRVRGPASAAPLTAKVAAADSGHTAWARTGRPLLKQAKDSLQHGEFLKMIESDLPFGRGTAARLMKSAADNRIV